MNVLHYSFSLSACPKCHLLICEHTSLADLDFKADSELIQFRHTTISIENNPSNSCQPYLSAGTNIYLFPPTISDNRYSWTTFGTSFDQSTDTLNNLSSNNETIYENIPFANENIISSSLLLISSVDQIVRTQPEKVNYHLPQAFGSTTTHQSSSFSALKHIDHSTGSFFTILLLILLFLLTNTIDIVLIYISYHFQYIYLITFLSTIFLCDMILWINNLIQSKTIPSCLLLIPFSIRFHLLYDLLELLLLIIDRKMNRQVFNSLYQLKKSKLYQKFTLFYLIHTSLFSFVNLYFWSNHFHLTTESSLNMDYFLPQWTRNTHPSLSILTADTTTTHSSFTDWPLSDPVATSSIFVLISILYYLIINYSLLSTYLLFKRFAFLITLSRLCLIIPRLYTFLLLIHSNTSWLFITFLLVHLLLMLVVLFDRSKFQHEQKTIFLQIIFSFITHQSIDDLTINAFISLENISIFFHRLYLEIFAFSSTQTTWRFSIFLSILIVMQMLGFIMNILSKYVLDRTKP